MVAGPAEKLKLRSYIVGLLLIADDFVSLYRSGAEMAID
jgi:hypothetical protein